MTSGPDVDEALILAGGKGTRIQHLLGNLPKPMVDVAGRPFIERVVLLLKDQGIRRIILSTGYRGEIIEKHFGNGKKWNMDVDYSCDPFPLGTGGAVRHALGKTLSDRFLVLNGDSYCRFDLDRLEDAHKKSAAHVTIWLSKMEDCRRYGSVEIDSEGAVREFLEKPAERHSGLVNAGIYLVERTAAETIPEGIPTSIERDFFPRLVGQGLFAVAGDHPLLDIGTPETFAEAGRRMTSKT